MHSTEARFIAVIAEKLKVREERVAPTSNLEKDFGADSLTRVELLLLLEAEFQIDIPDEEAEELTTVQQFLDYINLHVQAGRDQPSRSRGTASPLR